ncbi:MAG: DUF1761 domain-containing protein [Hyphomicrobiaceae bacterium]|nr:DUF1761 domain-containing protein [Hyphomicrobiaceae bacterium]
MDFAGFNTIAILLAAAASFMFGGVWYGAFSSQWMAAAGVDFDELRTRGGPVFMPYAVAFLAQLVMAFVLAGTIGHLGLGQVTLKNGIIAGAMVWAGFVMTSLIVNHAFQGAPRTLTLIDGGHWLGVLVIQGAIIGWMGVA